ncbi:MAG TPA: 4Fe4S-binding leucine-rich repeat protein, partial [Macromonas sp.]|nr:4Fe4S-binding leucine-rich repeat protein [Macromonas sp.]
MTTPPSSVATAPSANDIPVQDWRGQAIDCGHCPHQVLRVQGGCVPGRACVQDAYARRIDRFFRHHPQRAVEHLQHPYFEVRAIAARYVDPFHLPTLLHDPDETVRLQVALRLPLAR